MLRPLWFAAKRKLLKRFYFRSFLLLSWDRRLLPPILSSCTIYAGLSSWTFNIDNVTVSLFANSSYLLCADVRRAVGTAAAMPPSTRSFFLSGAFLLALWKSWSSGPVRTWPTTVTTQHHIQGRRWSSMQNQVWATVSHGIILNTQSVSTGAVPSRLIFVRSMQLKYHVHHCCADDGWWLTVYLFEVAV